MQIVRFSQHCCWGFKVPNSLCLGEWFLAFQRFICSRVRRHYSRSKLSSWRTQSNAQGRSRDSPPTCILLLYLYRARNKITQLSIPTHAQLQRHSLKFIKNHLKNSYMFRSLTIFRELQCPR